MPHRSSAKQRRRGRKISKAPKAVGESVIGPLAGVEPEELCVAKFSHTGGNALLQIDSEIELRFIESEK